MKMIFLSFIFFGVTSGRAAVPPSQRFVNRFVQSVNDRLESLNMERTISGNRLYCPQLSDQQVKDMEDLFITTPSSVAKQTVYRSLDKVTVGQFIAAAADNLGCYPSFWPTQGRSTLGGVLFNSKAFVMDLKLLQEAMAALAGHAPDNNETLASLLPKIF